MKKFLGVKTACMGMLAVLMTVGLHDVAAQRGSEQAGLPHV